jgi:small-conductance mechanosensitive channel
MGLYRLGDRIRLGEVSGDVVEMDLMMTRVRTPKNELVAIPNSSILNGQLINYSTRAQQEGLILHTSVTIGYDTPWRQVNQMLLEAARKTTDLLQEPPAFVLQTRLDDFYVAYQLNAYTRRPNTMERVYSELHQNILDEFNRAGVQIMSPHYEADPEQEKLVPRDRWEPMPQSQEPDN